MEREFKVLIVLEGVKLCTREFFFELQNYFKVY